MSLSPSISLQHCQFALDNFDAVRRRRRYATNTESFDHPAFAAFFISSSWSLAARLIVPREHSIYDETAISGVTD